MIRPIWLLFLISFSLFRPASLLGQTIPSYISSISDYQVRALSGAFAPTNGKTSISDATPSEWLTSDPGTCDLSCVIAAWSGGAGAVSGTKLFVHGGGHNDSANNGIYVYDFSGTTAPTGWTVTGQSAVSAVAQGAYTDGRPRAVHTYNGMVYAHGNNTIYRLGGAPWSTGGGFTAEFWKFNVGTATWTRLTNYPYGSGSHNLIYDPVTGKILASATGGYGSAFFNTSTETWSAQKASGSVFGGEGYAAWDPTRGRAVQIGNGTNKVVTINFSAETVSVATLSASGDTTMLSKKGAVFYDQARDVYWMIGGDNSSAGWSNVYEMNASTFVITAHPLSAPIATTSQQGSYGRFVFLANWRAIGIVGGYNTPAYVIKLPPASGTTPPPTFDFSLATGGNKTVSQGQTISNVVTTTLVSGTTQVAAFSVSGLPSGATGSFSQTTCTPTCSTTLNISTLSTIPTGNYTVNVAVIAGSVTRTSSFTLTVSSQSSVPPPTGSLPVGNLVHDGPATPEQLSLYLPITGTLSQSATATVRYKPSSSSTWIAGHPLFRIRPASSGTPDTGSVPNAFAWPLIDLTPGTSYNVEVTVTEGGVSDIRTATLTTRSLPAAAGTPNKTITAGSSTATIQAALDGLNSGDVLQFQNGTYNLTANLQLNRSGTSGSPFYIRGESRGGVILSRSSGRIFQILDASNWIMENFTIQGSGVDSGTSSSSAGIEFHDSATGRSNITVRNLTMNGVDRAFTAINEISSGLIYDNTFTGNNTWITSLIDTNATWNDDGINLSGFGNAIFNNTLTGFGDTISFAQHSGGTGLTQAIGVHAYRNDIRNSGDDLTEVDYAHRNISFYDNRSHNSMTALSLDPVYGGPFLYARNIVINIGRVPFKWNSANSGQFVYNNTIIRTTGSSGVQGQMSGEAGWYQSNNGAQEYYGYRNNILIYQGSGTQTIRLDNTGHSHVDFSYNSWYPNATFQWSDGTFGNLSATYSGLPSVSPVFTAFTKRHEQDNITTINPWTTTITLGANYQTAVTATHTPTLASGTAPKNSGVAIANITDGFSGAAPDRGALIAGRSVPMFGDRSGIAVTTAPAAPSALVLQ